MSDPERIPVHDCVLSDGEIELVNRCLRDHWISGGPMVAALEKRVAGRAQRAFGVAVSSGSAALELAVDCLSLKPGDEVIVPAFTIISTVAPLVRRGLVPVLVDADPDYWTMDLDQVARKIGPRTRAVVAVHLYGLPVSMPRLVGLAYTTRLKILEDASQALGQRCGADPCGSFGELSTFSFYPNKLITTGEGGLIVTDEAWRADACAAGRNLFMGRGAHRFVHEELGWNFRLTDLQAAIGVAQCDAWDSRVRRKRAIGAAYTERLTGVAGLQCPAARTDYADNHYWVYGVVLTDERPDHTAEKVITALDQRGIESRPFFCPMHQQPALRKRGLFKGERYPVAERLFARGLYLPSGLTLNDSQIDRVTDALKEILKK